MTELQELNEKIARWCGFEYRDYGEFVHGYLMHGGKVYDKAWFAPNGDNWLDRLPKFTDPDVGLGLLFKYAVPKLDSFEMVSCVMPVDDYKAREGFLVEISFDNESLDWFDPDPTLALCRAVEKLIDKEG